MSSDIRSDSPADPTLRHVASAMLACRRHSWEQGVAMQALDAIGAHKAMLSLAYETVCATCVTDGRVGVMPGPDENAATDPCACGIGLARAYALTGDDLFAQALHGLESWALQRAPRRADGVVYHEISQPRIWVDSFFMLPPFLADRGHIGEAYRQIRGYWNTLADPATGLLHHMWDDQHGMLEWPHLWATGNGWALAGLAQVIERDAEKNSEAINMVETVLNGLAPFQRDDGLFHNEINHPGTFADAAGACLSAYAIFTGLGSGWLSERYAPMAERMRSGTRRRLNRYGFVTGVPGAPRFESPGVSPEAQAAYLLMEAAAGKAS